jgi:hypothetical protein
MDEPYYTLDITLFEGTFRYFGPDPVSIRGKVHVSEEHYHMSIGDRKIEPVTLPRGQRTYIHMKPFVLLPNITLTVGLYQQPLPGGAIGEVVSAREQKHKEQLIGQAQAWYYPHDHLLVLWECFLDTYTRDNPLLNDPNMKALWEGFLAFLYGQFPDATRLITPYHDPIFEDEEYRAFLRTFGLEQQPGIATFGKSLETKESEGR